MDLMKAKKIFEWGKERELLFKDIDELEFTRFIGGFSDFLTEVIDELDLGVSESCNRTISARF